MSFEVRLRPELIAIAPPWRSFRETVEGLVGRLATAGAVPGDGMTAAVRAVFFIDPKGLAALLRSTGPITGRDNTD